MKAELGEFGHEPVGEIPFLPDYLIKLLRIGAGFNLAKSVNEAGDSEDIRDGAHSIEA